MSHNFILTFKSRKAIFTLAAESHDL